MSVDEFDPAIERLFARTPAMPDAALFTAGVERRLQKGSSVRFFALAAAGLIGGVIAVRETLTVNLNASEGVVAGDALGQSVQAVSLNTQTLVQSGLESVGVAHLQLGSMNGMQLFWIAAGALIAVAAAGVVRLSQEV